MTNIPDKIGVAHRTWRTVQSGPADGIPGEPAQLAYFRTKTERLGHRVIAVGPAHYLRYREQT